MEVFQTFATILGLTALFGFLNERLLGLQQTVGVMVIALAFTLVLAVLNAFGITSLFVQSKPSFPGSSSTNLSSTACCASSSSPAAST